MVYCNPSTTGKFFIPYNIAQTPRREMIRTAHGGKFEVSTVCTCDWLLVEVKQQPESHLGVSKNRGTPKWMVYNPIKMDDLGVPGNIHLIDQFWSL